MTIFSGKLHFSVKLQYSFKVVIVFSITPHLSGSVKVCSRLKLDRQALGLKWIYFVSHYKFLERAVFKIGSNYICGDTWCDASFKCLALWSCYVCLELQYTIERSRVISISVMPQFSAANTASGPDPAPFNPMAKLPLNSVCARSASYQVRN